MTSRRILSWLSAFGFLAAALSTLKSRICLHLSSQNMLTSSYVPLDLRKATVHPDKKRRERVRRNWLYCVIN
jgi:hypothetical protein